MNILTTASWGHVSKQGISTNVFCEKLNRSYWLRAILCAYVVSRGIYHTKKMRKEKGGREKGVKCTRGEESVRLQTLLFFPKCS